MCIRDRSEWAWSIEAEMIKKGASKEEVKFLLLNAPDKMAKFTKDNVDKELVFLSALDDIKLLKRLRKSTQLY